MNQCVSLSHAAGSEDANELIRPGTSKQTYETVNNEEVLADQFVIEDDEDMDYDYCLDSANDSLVKDEDVIFVEEAKTRMNALSHMDVTKLHEAVRNSPELRYLFRNHYMEPLTFLLLLHDFGLELKLTRLIEDCGGVVYNTVTEIDGHTIVIVKDESLHWSYLGVVFKVSYIQACVDMKKILNITRYFKSSVKLKFKDNLNFMNVVYFKKYTWDSIPEKYIVSKNQPLVPLSTNSSSNKGAETVSSDDEMDDRAKMPPPLQKLLLPVKNKGLNKHTRMLYSRKEDEDILKYIIQKEGYDSLKGNQFWKIMENYGICPNRTWQSVKEHFIKKTIYNLSSFTFLTDKQIHLLQVCVFRK